MIFSFNLVLGLAYSSVIVLECCFLKHIFRRQSALLQNYSLSSLNLSAEPEDNNNYHQSTAETASPIKDALRGSKSQSFDDICLSKFILFHLSHHPLSKLFLGEFPDRIYEFLLPTILLKIIITMSLLRNSFYALALSFAAQFLLVVGLYSLREHLNAQVKEKIKSQRHQNTNFLEYNNNLPCQAQNKQPTDNFGQFSLRCYIPELVYCLISALALGWVGARFQLLLEHKVNSLSQLKLLGIGLVSDLFVIRPIILLLWGVSAYRNYVSDKLSYIQKNIQKVRKIVKYTVRLPPKLKTHKSGMKEARQNSVQNQESTKEEVMEFTIDQNTEQQINPVGHREDSRPQITSGDENVGYQNVTKRVPDDMPTQNREAIVIITTEDTSDYVGREHYEMNTLSPERIDERSERASETVKKQQAAMKCIHIPSNEINCIEEFQITKFASKTINESTKKYANGSLKKHIQNSNIFKVTLDQRQRDENQGQSLSEDEQVDEDVQEGLRQNFRSIQPNKYNPNNKKSIDPQSSLREGIVVGNIVDDEFVSCNVNFQSLHTERQKKPTHLEPIHNVLTNKSPILSNVFMLSEPKRKISTKNRKIHLVYNQDIEKDNDSQSGREEPIDTGRQNQRKGQTLQYKDKRSASLQDQLKIREMGSYLRNNSMIRPGDEKENVPIGKCNNSNLNCQPTTQFPQLKPLDLLLVREMNSNDSESETEGGCEENIMRRKRRRKAAANQRKSLNACNSKSPYLQFLPKMLQKQEMERNQSVVGDMQNRLREPASGGKRLQSKKSNLELHIIKKSIPTEIETVYT